jgi:hypothetical protein
MTTVFLFLGLLLTFSQLQNMNIFLDNGVWIGGKWNRIPNTITTGTLHNKEIKHTLILSLKNRSVSAVPQSSAAGIPTISKRIFNPHDSSAVCTSDRTCSTTTNIASEAKFRRQSKHISNTHVDDNFINFSVIKLTMLSVAQPM